jgi:hypothetical protein
MVCLSCAELKHVRRGLSCPSCRGPLLDETAQTLEQLVGAKLRKRLRGWEQQGHLDGRLRERLEADLPPLPVPAERRDPVSQRADAAARALPDAEDVRPRWLDSLQHALRERDDWQRKTESVDPTGDAAAGAGAALFDSRSTGALTAGLHSLTDLDHGDASLRSVIGEYVWWFIGTLLVLAGSVMGVREAWLALGGVPRLLVVAGALLAYHGGFVALSSVVAKKSGVAGRVLGGIALALLPVVFAALSALVALSLPASAAAVIGAAVAGALTLRTLSRRFEGDALALGTAFLPALLAELPLSLSALPVELRVMLPMVGVAACGLAARRGFAALLLSLHGLLALGVFTVVGAPGSLRCRSRSAASASSPSRVGRPPSPWWWCPASPRHRRARPGLTPRRLWRWSLSHWPRRQESRRSRAPSPSTWAWIGGPTPSRRWCRWSQRAPSPRSVRTDAARCTRRSCWRCWRRRWWHGSSGGATPRAGCSGRRGWRRCCSWPPGCPSPRTLNKALGALPARRPTRWCSRCGARPSAWARW